MSSIRDVADFDDIFKDIGFGGFRDIFEAIFEARGDEINDANLMKLLDDNHRARFQKELEIAEKKDTRDAERGVLKMTENNPEKNQFIWL